MIPKIIHYCWFGPKPFPKVVRKCIESWHKNLPDYEFRLWTEQNAPMEHPFVRSACLSGKFAFAADYVRFWALYHFGGIYLDTDMLVFKSFDDLLGHECFFAYETYKKDLINCAVIGCQGKHPIIRRILEMYDHLEFNPKNLAQFVVPRLITPLVHDAVILPYDTFYPMPYERRFSLNVKHFLTPSTYAVHLWNISWGSRKRKYKDFLRYKYKNTITFIVGVLRKLNSLIINAIKWGVQVGRYSTDRNFGDALNLVLVPFIFGKKAVPRRYCFEFDYKRHINIQCVGSVLADIDSKSVVCGIGAISENVRVQHKPYKIISVRGPLTRALLISQGIECPPQYGDPALLLPRIYKPKCNSIQKKIIGFIPHYADQSKQVVKEIGMLQDVKFIDILMPPAKFKPAILNHWKSFIDSICECEVVISSSLHGLIVADAYGIPTLWVKFGDDVFGNDFKFYDYYASLGISRDDISPYFISSEEYIKFSGRENDFVHNLKMTATVKPVENLDLKHFFNIHI